MFMDKKKRRTFAPKKEEEELLRFFHDARRYSIHLMFIELQFHFIFSFKME